MKIHCISYLKPDLTHPIQSEFAQLPTGEGSIKRTHQMSSTGSSRSIKPWNLRNYHRVLLPNSLVTSYFISIQVLLNSTSSDVEFENCRFSRKFSKTSVQLASTMKKSFYQQGNFFLLILNINFIYKRHIFLFEPIH